MSETALIAPLPNVLTGTSGPVRLTFDATLPRPVRLRDETGVKLPPCTHVAMTGVIGNIDAYLQPLAVHFLMAELRCRRQTEGPRLDCSKLRALQSLLFAYASTSKALQGIDIELRARLAVKQGDGASRDIDTRLDARIAGSESDDPLTDAATRFAEWAGHTWAQFVGSTLAPWVLASGITEVRLRGKIRPDIRQQLAAVGSALDAGLPRA
jgi:hypothetical protein